MLARPQATCDSVGLEQKELRKLKQIFRQIDEDDSGEIDYEEFFDFINAERTPFTDSLFMTFDVDGSGAINFDEFVQVMCTYCLFKQEDILKFCFETFDEDGSGTIGALRLPPHPPGLRGLPACLHAGRILCQHSFRAPNCRRRGVYEAGRGDSKRFADVSRKFQSGFGAV